MPKINQYNPSDLKSELEGFNISEIKVGEFSSIEIKLVGDNFSKEFRIAFYSHNWRISNGRKIISGFSGLSDVELARRFDQFSGASIVDIKNQTKYDFSIYFLGGSLIEFFCWDTRIHHEELIIFREEVPICYCFRPGWGWFTNKSEEPNLGIRKRVYEFV